MLITPAIDLKEGKCVRLQQGLMDKATVYSDDPATTAKHWESQGAELLHVVDLDGAFAGRPKNLDAIKAIRAGVRMSIEVGGGIRDIATIDKPRLHRHRPDHSRNGRHRESLLRPGGLRKVPRKDHRGHRREGRPGGDQGLGRGHEGEGR